MVFSAVSLIERFWLRILLIKLPIPAVKKDESRIEHHMFVHNSRGASSEDGDLTSGYENARLPWGLGTGSGRHKFFKI